MRAVSLFVLTLALVAAPVGLARAAPPPVAPRLTDLLGPPAGGPLAIGTTGSMPYVVLYSFADCLGERIGWGAGDPNGQFAIPFTAPLWDTRYSVRAIDYNGAWGLCSNLLEYHTVHQECPVVPRDRSVTRPPDAAVMTAVDYMVQFYYGDEAGAATTFTSFRDDIADERPALTWFGGLGLFTHMMTGALSGVTVDPHDPTRGGPILGNGIALGLEDYMTAGPLPSSDLVERATILKDYLSHFNANTRPGIYMDFGTQFYSDAQRKTGFWAFYDQWDSYAQDFDLGTKPPPPDEWLKTTWDPTYQWPSNAGCTIPPDFVGLAPEYCPDRGHGYRRFTVNALSSGFELYWTQVLTWMARIGYGMAFVDNAYYRFCWNAECEKGYDGWIGAHYTPYEIDHYLTETESSITQHASFDLWNGGPGNWSYADGSIYFAAMYGGVIAPDIDAVRGRYALRFESGDTDDGVHLSLPLAGGGGNWLVQMQLRTTCSHPTMGYEVMGPNGQGVSSQTVALPTSTVWAPYSLTVVVGPGAMLPPHINLNVYGNGVCRIWIDEVTATPAGSIPGANTRQMRTIDNLALALRRVATYDYWDSIVDQELPQIKQGALTQKPDFWLVTNSARQRRGAEVFMVERAMLERERAVVGAGSFPGTYVVTNPACTVSTDPEHVCRLNEPTECPCLTGTSIHATRTVDNILDYKIAASQDFPDEFAYHLHLQFGLHDHYLLNDQAAILAMAEAAAFSGGALVDLGLDFQYYRYQAAGPGLRLRKHEFMDWAHHFSDLYRCLTSVAAVGLVKHDTNEDPIDPHAPENRMIALAAGLSQNGLTYDVIDAAGANLTNFRRFRVVVYDGVPRIGSAEAFALSEYIQSGGVVIATDHAGIFDQYFRRWAANPAPMWPPVPLVPGQSVYPFGSGTFVYLPGGITAAAVLAQVPSAQTFPSLTPAQRATTRAAFWSAPDRVVAHVLNYATPFQLTQGGTPAQPVLSSVQVAIPTGALVPTTAKVYSPDGTSYQGDVAVASSGGISTVTLPSVAVYAVVVLR